MRWLHQLPPAMLPWLGLLYKLPALRRNPGNGSLRALCFAFFALGTALVLLLPPVYHWISSLSGVPHLARLLAHSFGLLNGWAVQILLLHLTHDTRTARRLARTRHIVLAGVLTVMATLFLRAPIESASVDFLTTYADRPQIAAYLAVYLSYVGYSLFDIGGLSVRYSRQARSGPLRIGLRLVAVGSLIGLIYPIEKTTYVLARMVTTDVPNFEAPLSTTVIAVSVLLVVTGLTLPSWGAKAAGAWESLVSYRLHQALCPLWTALSEAFPEIVMKHSTHGSRRQRLHRRVIEIRDGLLALRAFHEPELANEISAQLIADNRRHEQATARERAHADAVAVHTALTRKQAGQPIGGNTTIIAAHTTVDLLAEGRQLAMVSQAFAQLARGNDRRLLRRPDTPAKSNKRWVRT